MRVFRYPTGRITDTPFRQWPLHARIIEKLYRLTHGGQIRTLVISHGKPDGHA